MKKLINFSAIAFVICMLFQSSYIANTNSTPKTRMDTLMAYKWKFIESENEDEPYNTFIEFTQDSITDTDIWLGDNETDIMVNPYYLANELHENFESSMVGVNKNGHFIIVGGLDKPSIYWIKELSSTKMVLQCTEFPFVESAWTATPKE